MKPSRRARYAASITLSKGKMFEFGVPIEDHLALPEGVDLELQFPLAIGTIGDAAADIVSDMLNAETHLRATPPNELIFAAQVLVAFTESRVAPEISSALRLLAASAYYLADSPGSTMSLVKDLPPEAFAESDFLASAVRFALDKPWSPAKALVRDSRTMRVIKAIHEHFREGTSSDTLLSPIKDLRTWSYEAGTAHEVLLSDVLGAVAFKRLERSAWACMPGFSELPKSLWTPYLTRPKAVKEMWPSQRMLGDANLYRGASSVVQMPTSAGKTRATELILRAAFASGRTRLALLVAPFRALCQEIASDLQRSFQPDGFEVNQLSDAMQSDSDSELAQWLALSGDPMPHVVVLTPEKLLYLLRQEHSFVSKVGLVVYDEGHQFDSGTRGVTYELLLTSLKRLLPSSAQTVLISAVIKNAGQLASWLLDDERHVVSDQLLQTRRLVAFASFPPRKTGQLRFNAAIEDEQEFFVPRVMPVESLRVTSREKARNFPTKESSSVALYLGLKLVRNGGVAIYTRAPASASKLVRDAVKEVFGRGVSLAPPSDFVDEVELACLVRLYKANFGSASYLTKAAELGLFVHHGDTPHGIRVTIEHAMREGHINFIVCTSTLAQGVNLPIRYLLITATMQGRDAIKARDFHNLIGRAGRAGMYGEGTVVFTDHRLYDTKDGEGSYKWDAAQKLLSADSAADTGSTLLQLCKPLVNDTRQQHLSRPTPLDVAFGLIDDPETALAQFDNLRQSYINRGFSIDGLRKQLSLRRSTVEAIESFLMNYRGTEGADTFIASSRDLGRKTFAHAIGSSEEQAVIEDIFTHIAQRIERVVPEVERQARYGKSLFGIDRSQEIDAWVLENLFELQICTTEDDVFEVVWPFLESLCVEKSFSTTRPIGVNLRLAKAWLKGCSYSELLRILTESNAYIQQGEARKKRFDVDAVVTLCERTLGYEFALYLAGIRAAFYALSGVGVNTEEVAGMFDILQKRIKYGLPNAPAVAYFELGFSERVVAQLIANALADAKTATKHDAKSLIRNNFEVVDNVLKRMPSLFKEVLARVML